MNYHWKLVCPGCNKLTETVTDNDRNPRLKCGDCLMDRVEICELKVTNVSVECPHCKFGFPPSLIQGHIADKHYNRREQ